MTEAGLEVEPLSDRCGARIVGADLNRLSDEGFGVLRSTLAERGVIFIEDQSLTPEQHIAFARRWGEIDINNYFPADARYPEIAEVRKEKDQRTNIGGGWHTDHSYDQIPAMGSILLARETPPTGGDTLFSSMYAAYEGLSDGLKQTLESLSAVHSADHIYGPDGAYAGTDIGATLKGQALKTVAVHPVVITHPDSGPQSALRQSGLHPALQGLDAGREPAPAWLSLRPGDAAGDHLHPEVATGFYRGVG